MIKMVLQENPVINGQIRENLEQTIPVCGQAAQFGRE